MKFSIYENKMKDNFLDFTQKKFRVLTPLAGKAGKLAGKTGKLAGKLTGKLPAKISRPDAVGGQSGQNGQLFRSSYNTEKMRLKILYFFHFIFSLFVSVFIYENIMKER